MWFTAKTSKTSPPNGTLPACFSSRRPGQRSAIEGILVAWLTWTPQDLRTAIVLREIFGPPRSLQAFDVTGGF